MYHSLIQLIGQMPTLILINAAMLLFLIYNSAVQVSGVKGAPRQLFSCYVNNFCFHSQLLEIQNDRAALIL